MPKRDVAENDRKHFRALFRNFKHSYQIGELYHVMLFIRTYVLVILKYFWDAIDLTLDVYIFYQLETGAVLDNVIFRNTHVNNAIYVFAILGCVIKIISWFLFLILFKSIDGNNLSLGQSDVDYEYLNRLKYLVGIASFVFEDGPELILEYFYIEKYIISYSVLIVVKDSGIICLLIPTAVTTFRETFRKRSKTRGFRSIHSTLNSFLYLSFRFTRWRRFLSIHHKEIGKIVFCN